jgi:hypothetical protein
MNTDPDRLALDVDPDPDPEKKMPIRPDPDLDKVHNTALRTYSILNSNFILFCLLYLGAIKASLYPDVRNHKDVNTDTGLKIAEFASKSKYGAAYHTRVLYPVRAHIS